MQGKIHIYTGDGKGKTTSAVGLAVRASGWSLRVLFVQFLKCGWETGEKRSFEKIPDIHHHIFGEGKQITSEEELDEKVRTECREGFRFARERTLSGEYDVVILDEITVLLHLNIINIDEILGLMRDKPETMELILTGRYAPQELIEKADLVSDIKFIKHYFDTGRPAKKGIEF